MEGKEFRLSPAPAKPAAAAEKEAEDGAPARVPRAGGPTPPHGAPPHARVRCPVCDGLCDETPVEGLPAGRHGTGRVRCEGCGTLFLKKRPSLGELASQREDLFKRAFALPLNEERRRSHEQAIVAMRGYFKETAGKPAALNAFGKNVLEVDCGLGFRLRAFQSYGWTIAGTETSATAFEYARRQSLDVKHGWFSAAGFGRVRFDLVLFCGSFGGLPDPRGAIERLWSFLKPGGLVCVMDEPLAQEGEADLPKAGLFLYTAGSLKRLFCEKRFSFVSEETGEGAGTFWFKANVLTGCAAGGGK